MKTCVLVPTSSGQEKTRTAPAGPAFTSSSALKIKGLHAKLLREFEASDER